MNSINYNENKRNSNPYGKKQDYENFEDDEDEDDMNARDITGYHNQNNKQ